MPYVADNKDKLKTDEVSSEPAQLLPKLQNLLLNTEVQRERLIGLMHLYDPTAADNTNLKANTEAAGQISATEAADLSLEVQYLLESVKKLEEEVKNQKKANAQERLIGALHLYDPTAAGDYSSDLMCRYV